MRKQTRYTLLFVALAISALIVVLFLRQKAPPEAARLLPECDAIVYVNVKPLRAATHFDRTPVERTPEFQHFIDMTGIVPERDLDDAAFALHAMANPDGPNGRVGFTEVFTGRFDGTRLAKYLTELAGANGTETYAGRTVYTIPIEGRSLRVVQLGYDTIAASNMPTTEQIHGIIDRQRAAASPFAGSSLLSARYKEVPLLSVAWGVGRIGLPFGGDGATTDADHVNLFGLQLPFPVDSDFVASARFTTGVNVRVEEIAPSDGQAAHSAEQMTTMLKFVQNLAKRQADGSASLSTVLDGAKLEQKNDRVILTTSIPMSAVQGMFKEERR